MSPTVELQILSKVLDNKSISLLDLNGITADHFITYKAEHDFIVSHYKEYGAVPDRATFCSKFPATPLLDVAEPDAYLIDTLNEEHLYSLTVPIINELAKIVQTDARAAVEYLQSKIPMLTMKNTITGIDIISAANSRLNEWNEKKNSPEKFFIPSGFEELDEIIHGFSCGEELAVLVARTGQGKSWIILKMLEHAWRMNKRVGLIEPEMSANKTGYRFDTVSRNFSNMALITGSESPNYREYIQTLCKNANPFLVSSPKDFKRKITVSKLRVFIEANKLDILGIDGISYLADERKERGDNRTTSLTNISEDLMDLSIQTGVPIIVVCQSNREGAKEDDSPGLENIRDSDGIAYNASIVISIKQKGPGVELCVRKNRNGRSGEKILYMWDIDKGWFQYVPSEEDGVEHEEKINEIKQEYKPAKEVF